MSAALMQFQRTLESPAVIRDPAYQTCYEALDAIADRSRTGTRPVSTRTARAELLRLAAWAEAFAGDLVEPLDRFFATLEDPPGNTDPAYAVVYDALALMLARGDDAETVMSADQARRELLRISTWSSAMADDLPGADRGAPGSRGHFAVA